MGNLKNQFEDMRKDALTVPNFLSMLRIILIPFFVFFFLKGKYIISLVLVFISGVSDFLDGKIARRFNKISKLGKLLDPAADKLTQTALAIVFFCHFNASNEKYMRMFSYVFLLFCLKEILMIVSSFILLSMNIVPQAATIYGKVATFMFYIVMGLLLCFAPGFGALNSIFTLPHTVIMVMVTASALLTLVALFAYIPSTLSQLKAKNQFKECR